MNTLVLLACVAALVGANAYQLGGEFWQGGPSFRSARFGLDGSSIVSEFDSGFELRRALPEIVVARTEPLLLPSPAIYPVPAVRALPAFEHGRSDIIAGPSGTIIANKDFHNCLGHNCLY